MVKEKLVYGVIIFALLLLPLASAFTASISNPKMVLYENLTDRDKVVIENDVGVINNNDVSVEITIVPKGVWENRVQIVNNESKFTLSPHAKKTVKYTMTIDKAGAYNGDIAVTFTQSGSKDSLSLMQNIVVLVKDKDGVVPGSITGGAIGGANGLTNKSVIIAVVVALVLIIAVFAGIKFSKRKGGETV